MEFLFAGQIRIGLHPRNPIDKSVHQSINLSLLTFTQTFIELVSDEGAKLVEAYLQPTSVLEVFFASHRNTFT